MRSVNQEIAELATKLAGGKSTELWSFFCECGKAGCAERVELPLRKYRATRADEEAHVLAPDHVIGRARKARQSAAAAQETADAAHARASQLQDDARALQAEARQARRLAEARRRRPVLYLVSSRTSGPGRRVEGWLSQVFQRRRNHETFEVHVVDPDDNPRLVEQLAVDALPAVVVVENGKVLARLTQPRGVAPLHEILRPWLK